jgi:WD40 repeat protein
MKTVWSVDFNPSGLYFLSGSADGMVALWKTNAHSPVRLLKHSADVFKVAFAKNPSYAVSACYNGYIMIWHLIEAQVTKVNFGLHRK